MKSRKGHNEVTVIIPARDAAETLGSCLQAVFAQEGLDFAYEVLVVDDGSRDATAAIAAEHGARVIRQEKAGPAAARNAGARQARGEILLFTDADCAPASDWIGQLVKPFDDPQVVGAKGVYRTRHEGLAPRFVQREYEFKYRRMARQQEIDFIDTYSAAYRREVFLREGGFQPLFPHPSVEDQELSFRLARMGYRMVFAPAAAVYHRHDRSLGEYVRRKFRIGYWKAYMLRWLPERAFSDSHTPATQRWQIFFLGTGMPAAVLGWFYSPAWWLALATLFGFILTSLPFGLYLLRSDPALILAAPAMLLLRAGALGGGLLVGLLFPPAAKPPGVVGLSPLQRFGKRSIDLIGGALGLLLSAPLVLLAAIVVKLDSPGPAFFVQERVGEHGRRFRMYKLRTMERDAEGRTTEVLAANPLKGPVYKIPDDPRVTRVGRFLRRWSLDELPQFWNVLRGEMSLVGPRPEETWVVAQYDARQRQRLAFKPGVTGPMQVSGRGALDMEARLELELDYIRNYSLKRDVKILLRTLPAVVDGRGAH